MARRPLLQEQVTDALRKAIAEGRYRPGQWLRQEELAQQFRSSRIPIREALRCLESEGMVEYHSHKGAIVKRLSARDITEVFSIRALLESEASRRGAPNLTQADLDTMRAWVEKMRVAETVSDYVLANREFHDTLYRAAQMPHLLDLIHRLRMNVERYLRIYLGTLETIDRRVSDHLAILAACERRDGEEAAQQTARHIHQTADEMIRVLCRASLLD